MRDSFFRLMWDRNASPFDNPCKRVQPLPWCSARNEVASFRKLSRCKKTLQRVNEILNSPIVFLRCHTRRTALTSDYVVLSIHPFCCDIQAPRSKAEGGFAVSCKKTGYPGRICQGEGGNSLKTFGTGELECLAEAGSLSA